MVAPLPAQLHKIVDAIETDELRQMFSGIFADLNRLLDYLHFADDLVREPKRLRDTLSVFAHVFKKKDGLLKSMRACSAKVDGRNESLVETLEGVAFAVRHEISRVEEDELTGVEKLSDPQMVRARLERAQGLLSHCFQQSILTLAHFFQPGIGEMQLFSDFALRLEQSIVLHHDLVTLLSGALYTQAHHFDPLALPTLKENLLEFRKSTMQFLMYRDWDEYERQTDLMFAAETPHDIDEILDGLTCYLEALLNAVKLRHVLTKHFMVS